jgi:hypothetical protein
MTVREENCVETLQSNAERLLAEVRRGIDHYILACAGNQQGRA